jgi:C-terminal processing protease CtpA/Prc
MRIPSFNHTNKPAIDKMIADNFTVLTDTENLIIDVRGNGGGSDMSYEELIPLLYTNPVRTPTVSFLSTPLNIENTEMLLNIEELSEDDKRMIATLVENMKARPGEFVPIENEDVDVESRDTVYEFPRNVGIIVNDGCASTTEQFLLAAKQSRKVKLFGIITEGMLDASNVRQTDSPDGRYRLSYTTSLSARIPGMAIDDVGLQPDYYLDKTIPSHKWVEFVSDVLNN